MIDIQEPALGSVVIVDGDDDFGPEVFQRYEPGWRTHGAFKYVGWGGVEQLCRTRDWYQVFQPRPARAAS